MTDLSKTIEPRSTQLNADDLIAGPMTIEITDVKGTDEPQQPIAVYFKGDNGKPYLPGKSMRRVLVNVWGSEGKAYIGRSLTLYRDENVSFGGIKVGGIRISHMSHIDRPVILALTESRAKRIPFKVEALRVDTSKDKIKEAPREPDPPPVDEERTALVGLISVTEMDPDVRVAWVEKMRAEIMRLPKTPQDAMAYWRLKFPQLTELSDVDKPLYDRLESWFEERLKRLRAAEQQTDERDA